MEKTIRILGSADHAADAAGSHVLQLANDADPLAVSLEGITRVELNFPKFTDGRAYSQALLLRRRLRFAGDIRATGNVLIDQLVAMQRSGFTSAVLLDGKDAGDAQRQFDRFPRYYQGDVSAAPLFREAA